MSFDLRRRRRAPHFARGDAYARLELEQRLFAPKGMCFLQHDMDVANGSGATVRADLNNAIEALATVSSGATEPATTYAYQFWADSTAGLLKQRNAANTAWEVRDTLAETLAVVRSSNTILAAGDHKKFFRATATFTQTLTAAATLGDGWWAFYRVDSGVTVTFDPNASETIDGATTLAVLGPASGIIFCDGSNFFTYGLMVPATQAQADAGTAGKVLTTDLNRIALGTPISTTSGTAHDYTVPAGVREVGINFDDVSLSGTDDILVQIGPAAGPETTLYQSASGMVFVSTAGGVFSTAGFIIRAGVNTRTFSGSMVLRLIDAAINKWSASHGGSSADSGTVDAALGGGGRKAIAGVLTTVRITRTGTDTFDAGSVNITYER